MLSKSAERVLIKPSLIYSCAVWRENRTRKKNTRNYQKKIACINIRTFGCRRGLFGVERKSKKRQGADRWYSFNQKMGRSFERSQ